MTVQNRQGLDFDGRCIVIAQGGIGAVMYEAISVGSIVEVRLALPTDPTPIDVWALFATKWTDITGSSSYSLQIRSACRSWSFASNWRPTNEMPTNGQHTESLDNARSPASHCWLLVDKQRPTGIMFPIRQATSSL